MNIHILAQVLEPQSAWYENITLLALIALAIAIPLSVFVGNLLGKMARFPDVSWRISLVLFCVAMSTIVYVSKSANVYRESNQQTSIPFRFGVDLRGGVTIIGQMNDQTGAEADKVKIQTIIPRLQERIDPSGVKEIVIRALDQYKMEVIIPDVEKEEAEAIWDRLITAGQLSFRIVADSNQHAKETGLARAVAADPSPFVRESDEPDAKIVGQWYGLAREDQPEGSTALMPFKFLPNARHVVRDAQTGTLIPWSEIRLSNNDTQARREFSQWCKLRGFVDLEILMIYPATDRVNVEGKYITRVSRGFDQSANLCINFTLNQQGGKRLFALTSRNQPKNGQHSLLGMVLDNKLQSAPRINEPIRTSGQITGTFSQAEIDSYIAVLDSGKLDVALKKNWISMDQIRSALGEELKQKGILAISLSLGLVLVFMLFYYRFAGIVACVALFLNLVFTACILLLVNVNLTLTGLAVWC